MEQRVSLITLAVADLDRAAAFYAALGWRRAESPDGVVAFDLIGQTLGLYPRDMLAQDMGLDPGEIGGFSGITLAHNVREKAQVAPLFEAALAAGARGIKPPHDIFWGGHIAYCHDPAGHLWGDAHNPISPLGPDGEFQWNGAA